MFAKGGNTEYQAGLTVISVGGHHEGDYKVRKIYQSGYYQTIIDNDTYEFVNSSEKFQRQ